jgi:chromosome segregation ATPase
MSPLSILWLASALGAALFFASGFLMARAKPLASRMDAEVLEELEAELMQAQAREVAQAAQHAELQRRLQHSEQAGLALQQALEQAHAEYARLDTEFRGRANAAERISLLEQENSRLHTKVSSLRPPDPELGDKLTRLQSEHSELKLEVEPLRKAASSVPVLRREVAELRRALDEKRSGTRESVNRPWSIQRARQSGTALRVSPPGNTLQLNLEQQLSTMNARDPELTAVLTDARGFSLAGAGRPQHQRELSVVACLAQDLARRAENLLALEHIQFMEMAAGARALRVRFFHSEERKLSLGSLGKRRPDANDEEEMLALSLPELLFAAKSA